MFALKYRVLRDLNTDVSVFDWHARLRLVTHSAWTHWRLAIAKGLRENCQDVRQAGACAKSTYCDLSSFGPALFEIWWPDIYLGGPYGPVKDKMYWPELARRSEKCGPVLMSRAGTPAQRCYICIKVPTTSICCHSRLIYGHSSASISKWETSQCNFWSIPSLSVMFIATVLRNPDDVFNYSAWNKSCKPAEWRQHFVTRRAATQAAEANTSHYLR